MRHCPIILALLVAACEQTSDVTANRAEPVPKRGAPERSKPVTQLDPQATPPEVANDPKSPAAAVKVVEAYFAALGDRRYGDASRLFPASGMSEAEFAASYAKYRTFSAVVGTPGMTEGGAGSIYIEIPVVVTGTLKTGEPLRMEGPVALRRVNDVDGATPAQLRWHIFSSELKPRP